MRGLRHIIHFALSTTSRSSSSSSSIMSNEGKDVLMRNVLTKSQTIVLVGASAKKERPSNYVMEYLLQQGYTVIPINPGLVGSTIHGQKVYGTISDILNDNNDNEDEGENGNGDGSSTMITKETITSIDMIDIFRNADAVPGIVDEAIELGIVKSIWMQLGIIHEEAATKAREAGIDVVMDACPKIEIPRLGLQGIKLRDDKLSGL